MNQGTKSALGVCLSLLLGVAGAYIAFRLLYVGSGKSSLLGALLPFATILFLAGLLHGRRRMPSLSACMQGIAFFAVLASLAFLFYLGRFPASLSGLAFVARSLLMLLLATVPAWALGAFVGQRTISAPRRA